MNTPGFNFKAGKLFAFSEVGVIVLEGWPALKAIQKMNSSQWREFCPAFRVVLPYRPRKKPSKVQKQLEFGIEKKPVTLTVAEQRKKAFDNFRFTMPKPVAAAVERFQSHKWGILKLMEKSEAAIELAGINPALCFALGNYAKFREQYCDPERPPRVSQKRQRDIAEWLGFPGTDAAARLLAKLSPESASVELLRLLRAKFQDPQITKVFSHLPSLNTGVVTLALGENLLDAVTPSLLVEISKCPTEKYRSDAAQMLDHTLSMLRIVEASAGTPKIQSLERLRAMHSEISTKYLLKVPQKIGPLPPPPFRGTTNIVPILSVDELLKEGKLQDNCVATYAERIRKRTTFIFRILKPERATLSLVKGNDGAWTIGELECRGNASVSTTTRRIVEYWLEQQSLNAD